MAGNKKKHKWLREARRILGLPNNHPLDDVVTVVAKQMGVAFPYKRQDRYTLLNQFFRLNQPCWSRPAPREQKPTRNRQVQPPAQRDVNSDAFLLSYEWRRLRMTALKKHGARCQCCGSTAKDGVRIHVDHIKPRRLFPELALNEDNLQVLCEVCNHGKGNWDQTDWREPQLDQTTNFPRLVKRVAGDE